MCYTSMSHDDFAEPEVVHEFLPHELCVTEYLHITSSNCPRCNKLWIEIDAELDAIQEQINQDVDDGAFSETISY